MKRFLPYLGIGAIAGIGIDILTLLFFPAIAFLALLIPLIAAILGALIGGYWKHKKGAWVGGVIMGLAPLVLVLVLLLTGFLSQ